MNYFGGRETPTFDKSKWHYGKCAEKKPLSIQIDLSKATLYGRPIDEALRETMKDVNPIDELVTLMLQRYDIDQSIKKLLPKMTKDEITDVYHTLYRIAQKVNEREEQQ